VNPEPRFRDTARLATSTHHERVNQSERAVFGEHGFVSKTLRRCYDLIKRMIVLIQCFIQGSSSGPQHSLESVVAVGDPMRSPVLSPRARTNLCKPLKEDYIKKCREVHQVPRDELALLCDMTGQQSKRIVRVIKEVNKRALPPALVSVIKGRGPRRQH